VTAPGTLAEQAQRFAEQLTETVRAIAPDCPSFSALVIEPDALRFVVRQEPDTGIPLCVEGDPLLTLKVRYACSLDRYEHHLAVDDSHVKVYAGAQASGEPLFRYDFVRRVQSDIPTAHLQIHAHRDALAYVMSRTGSASDRGRERQNSPAYPRMAELHFPVGGARFRPCLEDVLDMLVRELGVDCTPEGREALAEGRRVWRETQLGSAVRDNPAHAAQTLRELDYQVQEPDGGHPDVHGRRLSDL
jgi:hypothetical protein